MTIIPTRRGAKVEYAGETMKVAGANGFDRLTLEAKDGRFYDASIADMLEEQEGKPAKVVQPDPIRLAKVETYRTVLMPLLADEKRTREKVAAAGKNLGVGVSATYAALARYEDTGDVNELPPPTNPGGRGKSRLPAKAEAIIQTAISEILLNRRQRRVRYFLKTVVKRLKKAGFKISEATLRTRVANVPPYEWKSRRGGYREAKRTLAALRGEAPGVREPLEVVQLDHWKVDLEVLSEDRSAVIGRAWLTLAIDVYSRAVWGWHLSLDSPGTASTGLCMVRGMTRKEPALRKLGMTASMPFYGKPRTLHLDNAGEFRGRTLAAACQHHDIKIKFRPIGEPQYGAYIERLNGTLAQAMKDLPGATGRNTAERKALRPSETARFTFDELGEQMVMLFDEYNNTSHAALGCTPLEKWTNFFFGPDGQARPTPAIIVDDLALRISWYPLKKCTLQRYGVQIDYLRYYSEEMDYLIENREQYGKVEVRRNPLDVREVFLLHPANATWLILRCREYTFPVASILELREARREARRQKLLPTPENLARIIERREEHAAAADKKTKKAERDRSVKVANAKLRLDTPKTLDEVPDDDGITLLDAKAAEHATPPRRDRAKPPTRRVEAVEDFEREAIAAAELSDEDIDAYLDS